MKIRAFSKILTVVAILAMVLSFASCDLFNGTGGALELVSFTVDRSSVKTNYLIGEEIDFSGIQASVKYTDETLNKVYTYDELTITYADDITATVGDKNVTVSFDDPHLNVKQETKVSIKVTAEPVINDEPQTALQFEKPATLTAFDSANADAGKSQYSDASFSGEFAIGEQTYVIGNENAFKLNPQFSVMGDVDVEVLEQFFSVVDIYVEKNDEYVKLTAVAGEGNVVFYYDGETLIATVDTYKGEYQFSSDAVGQKVKISVLPSEEYYIFEGFNAVVLEAEIIKAYNVYTATDLAVIDNFNDAWDVIKAENGLTDVVASGIVLHADIEITAEDVPASFFRTTEKEVVYTNSVTNEEIKIPSGTKYYNDWNHVYHRVGAEDFVIEGNLFTLDASSFPLIASPAVFGLDGDEDDYGSDFSNATLFKFDTTRDSSIEKPEDIAVIEINNIALIGNAGRDNLVDANGYLASAGGLILMKSSYFSSVTVNNAINNSFFISYFSDSKATIDANNIKCYDSYQNAAMAWGEAAVNFVDSYLNGSGGPIVIAVSLIDDGKHPAVTFTDTTVETHLEGNEIWFSALNATAAVSQMKALSAGISGAGLGSFVDSTGKMNVMGLLMAEGLSAEAAIGGIDAQGVMLFDNDGMNRYQDQPTWGTIYQHSNAVYAQAGTFPAYLTVYGADGNSYTVWSDGKDLFDLTNKALGTDASHQAIVAAFIGAKTVTLTQGGLSVVFEFYHY